MLPEGEPRQGSCEFCVLGWPRCPACAELTDGGLDPQCPHCSDTKGHVSPEAHADFIAVEEEREEIGWRCGACGWETFDLADMRSKVNWPNPDGSISLVCPACGAEGQFVDATRAAAK